MAKISSYPTAKPDGSDILIGTDVQTGQTRNFSIDALTTYSVDSYLKQISWEFIVNEPDPLVLDGKIFFNGYGGGGTNFSDITTIDLSVKMPNATDALPYLEYLIGDEIKFADRHNLGSFGIFTFNSITQVQGDIYRLDLTPSSSSVGRLNNKALYAIDVDFVSGSDKTFIFEQALPASTWIINHDLKKFPSVTVVDSANSTVEGGITYNNENQLTLTFTATFSGKAYLN